MFFSCKEKSKVKLLSDSKMEEVLYDYHIANGIIKSSNLDSATSKSYIDAVFAKHNITEAEFDSSMVYFMRHADKLEAIYMRLSNRIDNEARLRGIDGQVATENYDNLNGDTVNIWNKEKSHIFFARVPYNIMKFAFKADSTYHAGDRFVLSFDNDFLYQDGLRSGLAVMTLRLENDSCITQTVSLSSSGMRRLEVYDSERKGIKKVEGYIMHKESSIASERNSSTLRMMMAYNLRLLKMHTQEIKVNKDTIENEKTDSLMHSTPEPMRVGVNGMHKLHSR